jgi:hypothetical protein
MPAGKTIHLFFMRQQLALGVAFAILREILWGRTIMPITAEKRLAVEIARRAILQQWQQRDISPDSDVTSEMFIFYGWLREARPTLLEFESKGHETWRVVQAWLEAYERGHPRM